MREKCILLGGVRKSNCAELCPHVPFSPTSSLHLVCAIRSQLLQTVSPMLSCLPSSFSLSLVTVDPSRRSGKQGCENRQVVSFPRSLSAQLQFGRDYVPLSKANTSVLNSQVTLGHCSLICFLRPRGGQLPSLLTTPKPQLPPPTHTHGYACREKVSEKLPKELAQGKGTGASKAVKLSDQGKSSYDIR